MKCAYAHCKHENKEIIDGEEYVVAGRYKYHKDCNQEREKINEIITIFIEQVNPNIVVNILRRTINNLINDSFEVDYILFAVKYAVNHPEMKLTYPQGLYRICKDIDVLNGWQNLKVNQLLKDKKVEIKNELIRKEFAISDTIIKKKNVSDLF